MNFTDAELAETAHRVYCECLHVPSAIRSFDKMFWEEVAALSERVIGYVMRTEGQIDEMAFGKILFGCMTEEIEDKWERLASREKYTWMAIGRHMINCRMIRDEKLNLVESESFWPVWVDKRLGITQEELVCPA